MILSIKRRRPPGHKRSKIKVLDLNQNQVIKVIKKLYFVVFQVDFVLYYYSIIMIDLV